MTTFTFRMPDSMAGRLSSADVRSWLTEFLRTPHSLPPDPGSGYQRTSLTLPRELVQTAAGYLRCSPSVALRRLALERLGPSQRVTVGSQPLARPMVFPVATQRPWRPAPVPGHAVGGKPSPVFREDEFRRALSQVIVGLLTLSIVVLVLYVRSKIKKRT